MKTTISLASWLEADSNRELCNMAGDIAYDAIAAYYDARDLPRPITSAEAKSLAADVAFAGRRGWEYAATDTNDPVGEIAKTVLAKLGYSVRAGTIGYDAIIQKT